MELKSDWNTENFRYAAFSLVEENDVVFEGNDFTIDGGDKTVHLLTIHNCTNCVIKNVKFTKGNTDALRFLRRNEIPYRKGRCSVFEVIDGGAVIISGKSSVTFENCHFADNKSIMCGGAVSNQSSEKVIFSNCLFENNVAGHTGSAIDNLVNGSEIEVLSCEFINNRSNAWHMSGAPHGQISVFPQTTALIKNSRFSSGSIPFDYYANSTVISVDNKYDSYFDWTEKLVIKRKQAGILDSLKVTRKMWWVMEKTIGKVYYRVNV